ncbi:MAG: hypothetical protein PHR43_04775 [Dehalococcoidales bacterium]|nr:hypothetical protein [Dehalococcoidales bacterium]
MDIFNSLFGVRIAFILGMLNLLLFMIILLTCRCLPTSRIGKNWLQNTAYKSFYKYHCHLWWIFGTSVLVHAVFAIGAFGIPF